MRLILRILGTWLLGLALILLVIDGTKSLGANALVLTSLGSIWSSLHADSQAQVSAFFAGRMFAELLQSSFAMLLSYPAFAVVGVPGLLFAILGRSRKAIAYVTQDQL
ncbi:hypothetical protein [Devosia sp.]|uniref:hypothetical protein n=1 Tax=Devosia sp. TaxID=1871048 RepID=UPI003265D2C2